MLEVDAEDVLVGGEDARLVRCRRRRGILDSNGSKDVAAVVGVDVVTALESLSCELLSSLSS